MILNTSSLFSQTDVCADATKIVVSEDCQAILGSTVGLDIINRDNICRDETDDDGWYQFQAISNLSTVEVFSESKSNIGFSVYENCDFEFECIDMSGVGGSEIHTFRTTPGNWYNIQVYEINEGPGDFFICVRTKRGKENGISDCPGAEIVCEDGLIVFEPIGFGEDDFSSPDNHPGCFENKEHRSAWYYFEIAKDAPPNLDLTFTITPEDNTDYDFALFGPNVPCDSLGYPIRCSWAAYDCLFCPQTGLGAMANDASEDATGDGFLAPVLVQPGEGYFLLVDNYFDNTKAFTLEWGGSAAPYLNCEAETPCEVFADAGDPIVFCEDRELTLTGSTSSQPSGVEYLWELPEDGHLQVLNPKAAKTTVRIENDFEGTVAVKLTARRDLCTHSDLVFLIKDCDFDSTTQCQEPIKVYSDLNNPDCNDPNSGSIQVVNIENGSPPFRYRLNEGAFQSSPLFKGLEAGSYSLYVKDIYGCVRDTQLILEGTTKPIEFDLGPDLVADLGDTLHLSPAINIPSKEIVQVNWSEPVDCIAPCLDVKISPTEAQEVMATLETTKGCLASDAVSIQVVERKTWFYPTAFSPNGDGVNDRFTLYADTGIQTIQYLRIYDRWGNLVFERLNFPPNQDSYGWVGTINEDELPTGTYLFQATLLIPNGDSEHISGAFTLLR